MRFVILGSTQLHVEGRDVYLGALKQRGLFALLLYHAGRPVQAEVIVDELWPGETPVGAREKLYHHMSRVRQVLKRAQAPGKLTKIADSYQLEMDPHLVDLHLFRHLTQQASAEARAGEHQAAADILLKAMSLWQSTPLADLRGDWSAHRRRHLTDMVWLEALKRLFDSQLAIGAHDAVLDRLGPLLEEHDVDETLARQWISALDGSGRASEASNFYLGFRLRLLREVGSEPSGEVTDAYHHALDRRSKPETRHAGGIPDVIQPHFTAPRQLPRDISDFTGHEPLLRDLDAIVDDAGPQGRVIALDGMPAVGKTTLATHWAHRRRSLFPDGQLYLDACGHGPSPQVQPREALGRFLSALGLPKDRLPATENDRRDRLRQLLDGRQVLILVDNARDSRQVRPLLTATANCTVLITSRNRLRSLAIHDGVHSITVPPLSRAHSAALLQAVVGAQRATCEPQAVLEFATLSGGLPLALRIIGQHAAERPRTRLDDLVDQLRRHLLALGNESDDEDRTLRAVFTHSYQDLPTHAQRLFQLASLHPGACFSAEAAAALAGADPRDTEHSIDVLTRGNLLQHEAAHRFRFHDLLRRFAADCAHDQQPAEHRHAAIERLLDWYLLSATNAATRLAPQRPTVPDLPPGSGIAPLDFDSQVQAMRWCEQERANLTAATRWAAQHGFHNHAWQIPGAVHEIFERYGPQDDVLESGQIALSSARRANHPVGLLGTLNNLGVTWHGFRDLDRATAHYQEGIQLAQTLGHREGESAVKHNLANTLIKRRDFESAIALYQQARQTSHDLADAAGEAASLHRLGKAYRHMGQHQQALLHHRQALAIREHIGHQRGQGASHTELAALALELGDHPTALKHAQLALTISAPTKDQVMACDSLITRAATRLKLQQHAKAAEDARRAIHISDDIADSHRRARALDILAEALAATGDHDAAQAARRQHIDILADVEHPTADTTRHQQDP